jgi:predicted PurR-regulated permease PerM
MLSRSRPPRPGMARFALPGLFLLAFMYTLYFARPIVLPVVSALVLSLLLAPAVGYLQRLRLPPVWGAGIVVGVLIAALGAGGAALIEPAGTWIERAPSLLQQMEDKLRGLRESVHVVAEIAEKAEKIAGQDNASILAQPGLISRSMMAAPIFLVSLVSTVILLYLLLAYGGPLIRRLVRLWPDGAERRSAIDVARSIQADIARYLGLMVGLSIAMGVVSSLAMIWLDMPNPVLWGVLVGVLNLVPYLGAVLSLLILTPVAMLSIEPMSQALLVPAVFLVLNVLEGELLTPIVIGKYFTLNPIIVFLSILFWGWLWGVVGTLVAVPILVSVRIFCAHVPALQPLAALVGKPAGNGDIRPGKAGKAQPEGPVD